MPTGFKVLLEISTDRSVTAEDVEQMIMGELHGSEVGEEGAEALVDLIRVEGVL